MALSDLLNMIFKIARHPPPTHTHTHTHTHKTTTNKHGNSHIYKQLSFRTALRAHETENEREFHLLFQCPSAKNWSNNLVFNSPHCPAVHALSKPWRETGDRGLHANPNWVDSSDAADRPLDPADAPLDPADSPLDPADSADPIRGTVCASVPLPIFQN